jgi:uncharacterized delta-60 repeat protein
MARRLALLAPSLGLALVGCPGPMATDDAAMSPDAFSGPADAGTDGAMEMADAHSEPDAFAASDAFVAPDAFAEADAFVAGDAGPSLPAITDPTPHLVPASADGHDRLFDVVFAPDSSFYVVGVRAAGTDAATNDFETIVGHFTASGDLDTAFGTGGWFVSNLAVGLGGETARGIGLQSDGRIVVAATVEHVAVGADARDRDVAVIRLDTDGTLDDTFGTGGVVLLDLSDGEAVPAPGTGYAADGAWNLVVDAMDRIVVAVQVKRMGATDTDFGLVRLAANGALDTTFAGGGLYTRDIDNVSASVRGVEILPDGRLAGTGYYSNGGSVRPVIYMVDDTGDPVDSFGTAGLYTEIVLTAQTEIYAAALQGDSFVTVGYGRELGPEDNDFLSLRVSATTGMRDLSYGGVGYSLLAGYDFGDNARDIRVLPDGRPVLVGALRSASAESDAAVVVLTADGAPDASYGTGGVLLANSASGTVDHFWGIDVDPTGTRMAIVGIGGTNPATDDDALVYLSPIP